MKKEIDCPVCDSKEYREIALLKEFPISNLNLATNREDSLQAEIYDMNIGMCQRCTHIYNKTPINIEYKQSGNVTYFTNELEREYIIERVFQLNKKYDIKEQYILEIGCGDGTFLKELAKKDNQCIGYEPSYNNIYRENNLTIINDYFSPNRDLNQKIDWIIIRHVLEHFEDPFEFLGEIIKNEISNTNIRFYLEVPNIAPTLKGYRVNDFIHEHISHFSLYSMRYLLNRLNLDIIELYSTDNNENIVAICKISEQYSSSLRDLDEIIEGLNGSITRLQEDYQEIVSVNKIICIWGAEGRGAGFIKTIKNQLKGNEIIVDSDNKKFNKFIPSIGLKISSYQELIDIEVDTIIITTALGKDNILREIVQNNIQVKNIYYISEQGLSRIN